MQGSRLCCMCAAEQSTKAAEGLGTQRTPHACDAAWLDCTMMRHGRLPLLARKGEGVKAVFA